MTWGDIALRDIRGARRSIGIWLLGGGQLVIFAGFTLVHLRLQPGTFLTYIDQLTGIVTVTVPLIAVLTGYKSVLAERVGGQLRLVLSCPHTRQDVAIGKLVGRSVVFTLPTVVAIALSLVLSVGLLDGRISWTQLVWFATATTIYGVSFVGIAVGVSLSSEAGRRVSVGVLGAYVGLCILWEDLHSGLLLVLHRFDTAILRQMPEWALITRLSAPSEAYDLLIRAVFAVDRAHRYVESNLTYLTGIALVFLIAWTVLPVMLGYLRFKTADL